MVRRILSMAALVCLSGFVVGCAKQGPIYRDRPVEVLVPVAQVCASTRPAKVPALRDTLPRQEWDKRDVRQKAATIGKQALDRQTYGEQLDAATGACPLLEAE